MSRKRKSIDKSNVNHIYANSVYAVGDIRLANKAVGHTASRRLEWALKLAQSDLSEFHAGDRLRLQLELAAFILPHWAWGDVEAPKPWTGITWEDVAGAHGLMYQVLEGDSLLWGNDAGHPAHVVLAFGQWPDGYRYQYRGDPLTTVLMCFGDLLNEFHDQIRTCKDPQCGKSFIGSKGKEYCDRTCLMRHYQEIHRHRKGARK